MITVDKAKQIVKNYGVEKYNTDIYVEKDEFGNTIMYFGADFDDKENYLKGYLWKENVTHMTEKAIIDEIERYEDYEINEINEE